MIDPTEPVYVYILQNEFKKFYTGITANIFKRLLSHNAGNNISTKYAKKWELIFFHKCENRFIAARWEKHIKKMTATKFLRKKTWQKLNYLA